MKKNTRKKWYSLLLVCLFILEVAFSSIAAPKENAAAAARKGVVRIMAVYGDGCGSFGSGFGVGKPGEETDIFATNWHVAVKPCPHGVRNPEVYILLDDYAYRNNRIDWDRVIQCRVLDTASSDIGIPDFAVLQAERKVPGRVALPLLPRDQCHESQKVFAIGFPGNGDMANNNVYAAADVSEVTSTEGSISRMLDNYQGIPYEVIQHSAHINHGNSGGPLITEDGAVIGLNTYAFGDGVISADVGYNPTENTVAVSIDYVIDSLDKLGKSYVIYTDEEEKPLFPWIGIAAVVLIVAAVAVVMKNKKGVKPQVATAAQGTQPNQQPQYNPQQQSYQQAAYTRQPQPTQQPQYTQQQQYQQPQQSYQQSPYQQPQTGTSSAYGQAAPAGGYGQPAASNVSQLKLKGTKGCFEGRMFAFSKERYQFGTSESCQLKYPFGTPGIGPVHCELLIRNGNFYLVDLGTQYGTYVNGKKITPQQTYPLTVGDTVCLASAQEAFQVVNN